jgi:hypothetical protein
MDQSKASRILACVVLAGALAGCSGSGSSGSPTSPTSGAATSAPTGSGSAGHSATSGTTRATVTAGGEARGTNPKDARKALPVVNPAVVGGVSYGKATAADRTRFAKASKAAGGLAVSTTVSSLDVSGQPVGAVAVYRTKKGLANSTSFQDQYLVQLINAVAGAKATPRFVQSEGQVLAMSSGTVAVVGWFKGDLVTLVYRQAAAPDLASLALKIRATPPTG